MSSSWAKPDIRIMKGDRHSPFEWIARDSLGAKVNFAVGDTVTFSMRAVNRTAVKVNAAAATIVYTGGVSTHADYGRLRYSQTANDVDEEGLYLGRFTVTFTADSKKESYPKNEVTDGCILIQIDPALA